MNLIYQYWDGEIKESCRAGVTAMRNYADRIGVEYIFEENPNFLHRHFCYDFGSYSPHYGAFKPVFDTSFDKYDKILFVDTDVFPLDNLTENIFDEFTGEIGICTEPEGSRIRTITKGRITHERDEVWAEMVYDVFGAEVPRDQYGVVVYNTGMVLYSKEARVKARKEWTDPQIYVDIIRRINLDSFYTCDQPYLHSQLFAYDFDVQDMNNGWNSYIHYSRLTTDPEGVKRQLCDWRNEDTKFVHVQFAGADNLDADTHWKIVNLPYKDWGIVCE